MIGICRYCGEEKELIQSHVIPKCFYQLKSQGNVKKVDAHKMITDTNPIFQNGLKEPLMCKECDTNLGRLDGYAHKLFFHIVPKSKSLSADVGKVYFLMEKQFDYIKLRKFIISLVWRVSVSSFPFSLGKYEAQALKILKDEIPNNNNLFMSVIFRRDTKEVVDITSGIFPARVFDNDACIIKFPNYEILIFTNPSSNIYIDFYKHMFTIDQLAIIEVNQRTKLDYTIAYGVLACKNK